MRLLVGKPLAEELYERSRQRSAALHARGIAPRLAAVSVGIDPAASTYQQRLAARGKKLDIVVDEMDLPIREPARQRAMANPSFPRLVSPRNFLLHLRLSL